MDYHSLQLLSKAPSKKYVKKLLEYALLAKSNFRSFDHQYQTPVAANFSTDMTLTEDEAQSLLINLGRLIDQAGISNFQNLQALFPQEFDEQLRGVLVELLAGMSDRIIQSTEARLTQAEKLISLDWRIDMQLASQSSKTNRPVILMTLETLDGSRNKTTSFQLSTQQITAFHDNLKKIKEQLNKLVN